MSEAELQLHRARRIGERWGWLTTLLYKNGSGMYSVKKKFSGNRRREGYDM